MNHKNNYKKYKPNKKINSNIICSNCQEVGHFYKKCLKPINSYGYVLLKVNDCISDMEINIKKLLNEIVINDNELNDYSIIPQDNFIKCPNKEALLLFNTLKENISILLVQRKHSFGFSEFVRGNYDLEDIDGISFYFKQMTNDEIELIKNHDFDYLWDYHWNGSSKTTKHYKQAKDKWQLLKENNSILPLNFYVDNIKSEYNNYEWGFPKGRKNNNENSKECAKREVTEETGIIEDDVISLDNFNCLTEIFKGTDLKIYKHTYFVGVMKDSNINLTIDNTNNEIRNMSFMNIDDLIVNIRPYHENRLKMISLFYYKLIEKLIEKLMKKDN